MGWEAHYATDVHYPSCVRWEALHAARNMRLMLAGGLTENDFIMASKINSLELSDLMPKKKQKFWA